MKYTLIVLLLAVGQYLAADPCGMVMPVSIDQEYTPQIERQGLQKTYVFFKDGIETFAVRPGFTGNVDNFGMLIPVPSMPSIRKIHDDTFAHIAAAIDPPRIEVRVGEYYGGGGMVYRRARGGGGSARASGESAIKLLKEEAVGMYQVAVLQAGSSAALDAWMTEKGFTYPVGMDAVCEDYIKQGWLFVAIKTRVSSKDRLDPRPGMQTVNGGKDAGAQFLGNVQGMAFRFRTDELVVPMRLSTYNGSDTRNIVYLLTDEPKAIENVPDYQVRRQISGEQLYLNLTQHLPIEIIGGNIDDISRNRLKALASKRNPRPYNGVALELFAADLLACKSEQLEHEFELYEKRLLNISEHLELRGADMDNLHHDAVWESNDADLDTALLDILDMTLTVIDGSFSNKVLREDNLHFINFKMPDTPNNRIAYDAVSYKSGSTPSGKIWLEHDLHKQVIADARKTNELPFLQAREKVEAIVSNTPSTDVNSDTEPTTPAAVVPERWPAWLVFMLGLVSMGLVVVGVKILKHRKAGVLLFVACGMIAASNPIIDAVPDIEPSELELLENPRTAKQAMERLVEAKNYDVLNTVARDFVPLEARGWAIVGLSKLAGDQSRNSLKQLWEGKHRPPLLGAWALAAYIKILDNPEDIARVAAECEYEAMQALLNKQFNICASKLSLDRLIELSGSSSCLHATLQRHIMSHSIADLTTVMFTATNNNVRRMATGYLAAKGKTEPKEVAAAYIESVQSITELTIAETRIDKLAVDFPWGDGALYIPSIEWSKDDARELILLMLEWRFVTSWSTDVVLKAKDKIICNLINTRGLQRILGHADTGYYPLDFFVDHRHLFSEERVNAIMNRRLTKADREFFVVELTNIKNAYESAIKDKSND